MKIIRSLAVIFLFSLVVVMGCDKTTSPCLTIPNSASYTVNAFDEVDSTSPYFNKTVVNFNLTENTTSYAGTDNCPDEACSINLQLQNVTHKKITFSYVLGFVYNNGGSTQSFQGTNITLDSAATLNVGTLSTNCAVVTAPTNTVQLSNISYH